jgi:prevent-host-death family protein
MCYSPGMGKTIGVRELRQNASSILEELLRTGESVTITSHGRPKAVLRPITADVSWEEQLVAEGRLVRGSGGWCTVRPAAPAGGAPSTASVLDDSRAER